jgi:predicted double-glycine peptidase
MACRSTIRALLAACALMSVGACAAPRWADEAQSSTSAHKFQSWQDLRYANVVRQGTDFTCGAAALATLARHFYGRSIEEAQITDVIKRHYTPEAWGEREAMGLSLLDLQQGIENFGFKAQGMKLGMDDLDNLQGPILVHLDKGEMRHFAVLRGVDAERVYLADPIGGNVRMPRFRFQQQWTGNALLVWLPDQALPQDSGLKVAAKDAGLEEWSSRRMLYAEAPPTVTMRQ